MRGEASTGNPIRKGDCNMSTSDNEKVEVRLRERAADGWQHVKEAFDALEPIVLDQIRHRVRAHVREAISIMLEPSDQGGPGWVLHSTILRDGFRLGVDDPRTDELNDDDELSVLLLEFGEFVSSESEPYPYELGLDRKHRLAPSAPMGWREFWLLVYKRAVEESEPPEDGVNALSAVDTCAELYGRFAPNPGATDGGRGLWDSLAEIGAAGAWNRPFTDIEARRTDMTPVGQGDTYVREATKPRSRTRTFRFGPGFLEHSRRRQALRRADRRHDRHLRR